MNQQEKIIINDTLHSLKLAFMIKAGIDITRSLVRSLSKNQLPKSYLKLFINEGTIRFCLFMGTLTFLKKSILYMLRLYYKRDTRFMAFVSGFISGILSLMIMNKSQRGTIALYLLVRALDTIFTSLKQRNIVTSRPYYYVLLFFIEQFLCGYAFFYETEILSSAYYVIFRRFYQFSIRDLSEIETYNYTKGLQTQ